MRGGDQLLHTLDEATLAVARGQTDAANRQRYYAQAIERLKRYQAQLDRQHQLGRATTGLVRLLGGYAAILIEAMR